MIRREFLNKAILSGCVFAGSDLASLAAPAHAIVTGTGGGIDIEEALYLLEAGKEKNTIPEIRPEILNNPRAVFLIETQVKVPRDERGFFTEARPELADSELQEKLEAFKKDMAIKVAEKAVQLSSNQISPLSRIRYSVRLWALTPRRILFQDSSKDYGD